MATVQQIAQWLATNPDAPRYLDTVLSHQTPEVRDKVKEAIHAFDFTRTTNGKLHPFAKPITTKQITDHYGMDPKVAEAVHRRLVDHALATGLQNQMGTDAQLPVPPPSLRDHISAAVDVHAPQGDQPMPQMRNRPVGRAPIAARPGPPSLRNHVEAAIKAKGY